MVGMPLTSCFCRPLVIWFKQGRRTLGMVKWCWRKLLHGWCCVASTWCAVSDHLRAFGIPATVDLCHEAQVSASDKSDDFSLEIPQVQAANGTSSESTETIVHWKSRVMQFSPPPQSRHWEPECAPLLDQKMIKATIKHHEVCKIYGSVIVLFQDCPSAVNKFTGRCLEIM